MRHRWVRASGSVARRTSRCWSVWRHRGRWRGTCSSTRVNGRSAGFWKGGGRTRWAGRLTERQIAGGVRAPRRAWGWPARCGGGIACRQGAGFLGGVCCCEMPVYCLCGCKQCACGCKQCACVAANSVHVTANSVCMAAGHPSREPGGTYAGCTRTASRGCIASAPVGNGALLTGTLSLGCLRLGGGGWNRVWQKSRAKPVALLALPCPALLCPDRI